MSSALSEIGSTGADVALAIAESACSSQSLADARQSCRSRPPREHVTIDARPDAVVVGPPAARLRLREAPLSLPRRLPEHLLARSRHGDRLGLPQLVDLTCELADLCRLLLDAGLQLGLDGPVGLGQLHQRVHVVEGAGLADLRRMALDPGVDGTGSLVRGGHSSGDE